MSAPTADLAAPASVNLESSDSLNLRLDWVAVTATPYALVASEDERVMLEDAGEGESGPLDRDCGRDDPRKCSCSPWRLLVLVLVLDGLELAPAAPRDCPIAEGLPLAPDSSYCY